MTTLKEVVERRAREVGLWKALREVYRLVEEGRLRIVDPDPPRTFLRYLTNAAYSLWLWTALSLAILTIVAVYLSSLIPPIVPLRYVFGTIYVLFLPGYALIEALYPEPQSLKPLERLALSIGLSLAVVPLIGLLLNYTPWGIRLDPIMASMTIFIVVMLMIAAYRKYRLFTLSMHRRIATAGSYRARR